MDNILSTLNYAEFRMLYQEHQPISDIVLLNLTEETNNKIYKILTLARNYNIYNAYYDFEKNYEYISNFIKQLFELFDSNNEINSEQKELCTAYLLMGYSNYIDTVKYWENFNKLKDIEVPEDSWLWVIREYVRYKLLSYLNSPIANNNSDNFILLREYVELLTKNKIKLKELSAELQTTI